LQQILWIETLVKLASGVVLCLAPATAIRLMGLAPASSPFWPRLTGALLLGLAAATFIEGAWPSAGGLGPAGCASVNLAAAATIAFLNGLGTAAPTRRGAVALWLVTGGLVLLALFEIGSI